jgi:hypothetical protein
MLLALSKIKEIPCRALMFVIFSLSFSFIFIFFSVLSRNVK